MPESPQQYAARITSYVAGMNHLGVLQSTPRTIAALMRGRPGASLKKSRVEGKWAIAELLAHLAESEIVLAYRLRLVAGEGGTPIQAFDQNVWQSNAGYLRKDPQQALELFTILRKANVSFLKSLTEEQWKMYGIHSERGEESVGRMVEMYAGHDMNHLRQIREQVPKAAPRTAHRKKRRTR